MNPRTILGAVALGIGLIAAACSSDEADDDTPTGGAGEGNEAGSGATVGSGGAAGGAGAGGAAGAEAGAAGAAGAAGCEAQALGALCELEDCPENLESVPFICGWTSVPKRWATQCGGTAVSNPASSRYVYFFNADDELVGAQRWDDDATETCNDHGETVSETFGMTCALEEPPTEPCEDLCPTQPLAAWCDEHTCPSDAAAARDCSTMPALREVWANDCGGVNVSEGLNAYGGTTWSFDAAGQLQGVQLSSDTPTYCDEQSYVQTFGTFCGFGTGEQICGDDGAGGAGGAAGAGGAGGTP